MENSDGGGGGRGLREPRQPPVPEPDGPPGPSRYATKFFTVLLFASIYLLSRRWRQKSGAPGPSDAFTPSEIAATVSLIASLFYLLPNLGFLKW
ncbi:putative 3-hydroxy-3-methylglutaryl-coenzyme A reductase [Cocos nucifera]|nr:putative 3-hydroxy-3-methylglutaryl-coenzyme A reductase [Cocos nucifera]